MASKKKLLTSAVALGMAAVLALGGTFAWQSINQTAVNEGSDIVNPGGRLHDDYDGETGDKDVYVENFTGEYGEDIYTRIRLEEYFKVAVNTGHGNKDESDVIGSTETDEEGNVTYNYRIFTGYDTLDENNTVSACVDTTGEGKNSTDTSYFKWTMGSEDSETVYYMPTFNLNKDSLVADVNGSYTKGIGVISDADAGDQYEARTYYEFEQTLEGTEIYDADENTIDEVGDDFDNLEQYVTDGNIKTKEATHAAKALSGTNGLISMEDWLALLEESENGYDSNVHGGYWVYDTDGWVYWSGSISAGNTTGLLLDSIEMTEVMDDGWYYGLNVVAQFITKNDMGQKNGTGFYDAAAGAAPTENALKLLKAIGVNTDEATPSNFTLKLMGEGDTVDNAPTITVPRRASIDLILEGAPNWLADYSATEGDDWTGSAVSCFTIGTMDGEDSALDGIGANGADEVFTFDSYGQLTLNYEDDTISFMAASNTYGVNETYEVYIVVTDGNRTWHGKIVVTGAEDSGDEIGGGGDAGKKEDPIFTVTDNDGDDSHNPEFNESHNNLTYTGPATEFVFAFDAPNTGWNLSLNAPSDTYITEDGENGAKVFYENNSGEKGDKVAAWDGVNTLTMESSKTLENCDLGAGNGSSSNLLHIVSITHTPVTQ